MTTSFDRLLHANTGEFDQFQLLCLLAVIPTGFLYGLNTFEIIFAVEVSKYSCGAGKFIYIKTDYCDLLLG